MRPALGWLLAAGLLIQISGCRPAAAPNPPTSAAKESESKFEFRAPSQTTPKSGEKRPVGHPRFANIAAESGLDFTYVNGADERVLMVESIGAGCGWIDYDRDSQWELYFPQGGNATESGRPTDQLFRRLGQRFVDVTEVAGIDERQYSQGVAVGDFNNDGFDDIFVTNIEGVDDVLYENLGDGTFRNIALAVGVSDTYWSSSAAWADLDRDGDLDLYVCNYVKYDVYNPIPCLKDGKPATCHPRDMEAVPDQCYENLGDGTFREVSKKAGLYGPLNRALGVVVADFDDDGWPDIYVANDTSANFLFINQKQFQFDESAYRLGTAFDARGAAHASMGVATGDYDQDGRLDLYITGFSGEYNTLYRNRGDQGFQDVTGLTDAVNPTLRKLGWGVVMMDFDQDGRMEILTANGHIGRDVADGEGYEMKAQLLGFDGAKWQECTEAAGPYFEEKTLARGIATADFDDDGDMDAAVVHQNSRCALLRNDSDRGHWLKLMFVGRSSNRRGIGVRAIVQSGDRKMVQEVVGGNSFASSMQPALAFGLGESTTLLRVQVRWPSGRIQELENVAPDQSLVLTEPVE